MTQEAQKMGLKPWKVRLCDPRTTQKAQSPQEGQTLVESLLQLSAAGGGGWHLTLLENSGSLRVSGEM